MLRGGGRPGLDVPGDALRVHAVRQGRSRPARRACSPRAATDLAADHGFERRSVWTFNQIGGPAYSSITREFYLGLGAGSASYSGGRFDLNHFGIEPYIQTLDRGELPIAREARLGPWQRAAYYLFWQCYTGRVDLVRFHHLFGRQRSLHTMLATIRRLGWIEEHDGVARLTPDGYDHYHDLERWVTYHMIEPLWAEMMREHDAPGAALTPAA